jgi:hypothetical protein
MEDNNRGLLIIIQGGVNLGLRICHWLVNSLLINIDVSIINIWLRIIEINLEYSLLNFNIFKITS